MTVDANIAGRAERGSGNMPRPLRAALLAIASVVLGSAVYLWAERGPALLLDLAHMGAQFLCL
ncbi:MAG: hypothetical protein ABL908_08695 [Hyphomicrobium sp.]